MEVSAKLNLNQCVEKAFKELFREIYMGLDGSWEEQNKKKTIFRDENTKSVIDNMKENENRLSSGGDKKGCC